MAFALAELAILPMDDMGGFFYKASGRKGDIFSLPITQ